MASTHHAYDMHISNTGHNSKYDKVISGEPGEMRPIILTIDSRYRDNISDTASNYTVTLPHPYKDVISVELVTSDIPNNNYNVTNNNNKLHILIGDGTEAPGDERESEASIITIAPGLYDITTLSNVLTDELQELDPDFNVSETTLLDEDIRSNANYPGHLRFTNSKPFTLYFDGGLAHDGTEHKFRKFRNETIAKVIGFDPYNEQSQHLDTDRYEIVSIYEPNLDTDVVVSMFLTDAERCESNNTNVRDAFALLPLNKIYGSTVLKCDFVDNEDRIKYYPIPVTLAKLRVRFADWDGNPYDFNGYNHILIFKIISLRQPKKL